MVFKLLICGIRMGENYGRSWMQFTRKTASPENIDMAFLGVFYCINEYRKDMR